MIMEMTMFDIGCINYKVKNTIIVPNMQLIANAISKNFQCDVILSNNGFVIENICNVSLQEVSEFLYRTIRVILLDSIWHITNDCIGYSPYKSDKDSVYYIDTYTNTLYTCIQLSPTSFNIILV